MQRSITIFTRHLISVTRYLSTTSAVKADIEVTEESSHVYHVKLNRPDRRNAFTMDMWRDMKTIFDKLADEPKCRAIVLSGNGKSFCAGIDLQMGMGKLIEMLMNEDIDVGRKGRMLQRFIMEGQDGFTAVEKCPKPVIAAVHSHCVGAGIDLITACDIRYASSDAIFNIKEVDIGMAADVGTLNRIQKVVGNNSWIRELAFTAKDVSADEAINFGLISRMYDNRRELVEGAINLAETIAEKSPIAVQGTKEVLNHARNHTIEESLNFVKTWNMSQLQAADLRNSAMAAMNKQKVEYENV